MNKEYLTDTISKYHLGGFTQKSKIIIKDKIVNTKFITEKRNLFGNIIAPGFDLMDCEFGIYDNSQLLKLIGITEDEIKLDIFISNKIATKILISDKEFDLEYSLADTMLIPKPPTVNEPEYSIIADIDLEFINKFIKAKKAIDTEIFSINCSENKLDFTLGNNESFTNKIQFSIPAQKLPSNKIQSIKFPIEEFREILNANKDMVEGKLYSGEEGLIKVEFKNEVQSIAIYYLVGIG